MNYVVNVVNEKRKDRQRFSGLREFVWKRDGYKCVSCSMTMQQHVIRWGKRLTINHINGIGRNHKIPDNRMENLETLCLKCHGAKDGGRWQNKD